MVVGFGKSVLRIDTTKVGKGESFSAEAPLKFSLDKLIDGVQLVGKHDGEVTELSMCQWMTSRLVSASMDGTVSIYPVKFLNLVIDRLIFSSSFHFANTCRFMFYSDKKKKLKNKICLSF